MTGDHDDATPPADDQPGRARLRAVRGPLPGHEPPPAVHLFREWKGVTVADLQRDDFVMRLPGQVRSALRHIERGDYEAAERALPGEFPPVLAGPGRGRGGQRLVVLLVAIAAVFAALAVAAWMGA